MLTLGRGGGCPHFRQHHHRVQIELSLHDLAQLLLLLGGAGGYAFPDGLLVAGVAFYEFIPAEGAPRGLQFVMQADVLLLDAPHPHPERPLRVRRPQTVSGHSPREILPQVHLPQVLVDHDVLPRELFVLLFGLIHLRQQFVPFEGVYG